LLHLFGRKVSEAGCYEVTIPQRILAGVPEFASIEESRTPAGDICLRYYPNHTIKMQPKTPEVVPNLPVKDDENHVIK
jgi:hypothetical protein